jgi:protein-S-isoprenylcysteine O-methyltransferase Ste14
MELNSLLLRQAVVLGSALFYWTGVLIHARRVRKQIGRSPNIKPHGLKEWLIWTGWSLVIGGWIAQPIIVGGHGAPAIFVFFDLLLHPLGIVAGIFMVLCGHAGTFWCYRTLGDAWRIGIDKHERTVLVKHGPYRFVRHPIYFFQIVILVGIILLLPTPFSVIVFSVHFICVLIKAFDEEAFLSSIHGHEYRDYSSRTGRLLPRIRTLFHASHI